jgi:hypothetical protein
LEDLFVINYRLQGLAEKKPETQETVLTKRIKYRVRSKRVLGWIGFGETIRSRGFLTVLLRHMKQIYSLQEKAGCYVQNAMSSPTSGQSSHRHKVVLADGVAGAPSE